MTQGFTISELRFRGIDLQDALVTFRPGLNVVSGPSNTGKSLIRAAINFVFGSSDPMRNAAEAAGFDTIFVQIRTADGDPITFERSWSGGDIRKYLALAREITTTTPSEILAAKHSADNHANIRASLQ
jgi:DNA repair ATPase RecN